MDPNAPENVPPTAPLVCSFCHQPIAATFYFCPNCGNKLNAAPLSTALVAQLGVYAWSIILPMICFITITKWPGLRYSKSQDPKAKTIGITAITLLILSTVITFWLAYVWIEASIQAQIASVNTDMNF